MSQKSLIDLFITFVGRNWQRILWLTGEHLLIYLIAVGITVAICVPLGIYLTRNERAAPYVIGLANVFQTVPSLALLGFLIFVLGIGNDNAICALFLYAMLPVLQNTYTGIRGVPKSYVQAARGMGMTDELGVSHCFKRLLAFELRMGSTEEHLAHYRKLAQSRAA